MKNILVPTDFSPQAHNAFEVALQLARRTGGRVTLLHVLDLPHGSRLSSTGGPVGGSGLNDVFTIKLLQVTKQRMHALMAEAAHLAEGVPVEDIVQDGAIETAILEEIRARNIDLMVLGSHEHGPETHFFSDSDTERLVRLASCPVLTVKHPTPNFDVHHIVFASDFSAEADRVVPALRQIQATFPAARLHLLDVVTSSSQHAAALERIHAFAYRHQLAHYEPDVFAAPKASTGIPRFAEQAHADLVVMLTHGRTGLSHLLQGSVAETVVTHTASPVLTVHI
ncbi:universal stress protein [Hymenobacter sp. B81]|uniref:universal stress protein n=1 Tax=Hymenobacter sp. B81 TaxID=3344878 RepID=UPI0037DDA229